MDLIVKSAIAALGLTVLVLTICVQRDALTVAKDRAERAERQISDRDITIDTLTKTAARNRQASAKLQARTDSIAAALNEREQQIESLRHANPAMQAWFDTPLPDALIKLRDSSAATGAEAASEGLPGSDALQSAGGDADN